MSQTQTSQKQRIQSLHEAGQLDQLAIEKENLGWVAEEFGKEYTLRSQECSNGSCSLSQKHLSFKFPRNYD